ncbi:MAG: RluA family pseudouridine synthase [Clostridia bacterium]|nr:RluA family pseudouridine synthase [Clostridia bacterium]
MTTTIHTVPAEAAGQRLDKYLPEVLELTRSAVQNLLDNGRITVCGKTVSKSYRLIGGEDIHVELPDPVPLELQPENIPLDIVYEDNDLLVVNKPKGMVVHPAAGNERGTLVNALLYHCGDSLSGINGVQRPGIVHRIDKDTSGLLIVAKSDRAHQGLAEQIQVHSFTRMYEAVAVGHLKQASGTVRAPIGRHPVHRKKMAVVADGRDAVTHYEVVADYPGFCHLRLKLETGRTHQIRVHMAYLGHPLAGDTVYGATNAHPQLGGQCLHARFIGFVHPITGEYREFDSPLPDYFQQFLREIDR